MSQERRRYSRDFKLAALERFAAAENVQALAAELGVRRQLLYTWRALFAAGGAGALRTTGRPRPTADAATGAPAASDAHRIAELERKVGQPALELDFFRAALRQVRGPRRRSGGPGGTASSR